MKRNSSIVFLGAGKMATAIAGGLLKNGYHKNLLGAFDTAEAAAANFLRKTGVKTATTGRNDLLKKAEVVIVAVKPQYLSEAVAGTKTIISGKLIVSIVPGVSISALSKLTGSNRIIRVMPNMPALIGAGVSAYTAAAVVSVDDIKIAEAILSGIGKFCSVPEKLLDAVTGLSGSGPAYVLEFIQALADGGVYCGLPREMALMLAAKTVIGSAAMMLETGLHPDALKEQVASPGGTTIRGLRRLAAGGFKGLVMEAVIDSAERAAELGRDGGK